MFTGIIRHVGSVTAAVSRGGGRRLTVDVGPLADGLRDGDSMAVNGVCLTAAAISTTRADFDVVAETVASSTLGRMTTGAKVNLERAMSLGDTLDGHLVQGHVDAVAAVRNIRRGDQWLIEFSVSADVAAQMVPKGSVAIDGVSLTLAEVSRDGFSIALIPTTLAETTLADLAPGRHVNIETDVIGKYVRRYLDQLASGCPGREGLTLEKLKQAGFV